MASGKTPKKASSAAQKYYRQSSSRIRGNESLDRLMESGNAPARDFSHSASGRTGMVPSYPHENMTPSGSSRRNNYSNPYNKQDLATYLIEKGQLREENIAVPDAQNVRNRQIGRPDWNPEKGRYGKVLLPSAGHNAPRIPRTSRARGGPGLMSLMPLMAGGAGTLANMIRSNNAKEMRKR